MRTISSTPPPPPLPLPLQVRMCTFVLVASTYVCTGNTRRIVSQSLILGVHGMPMPTPRATPLLLQRGQEQGHCSSNIWLAHVLLNSQCTAIRKGMEHTFGRAFVFFARLSRRIPISVGRGCIRNRSGVFGLSGAWPCAATFAAARIAKFIHVRPSRCFLQGVACIDATFISGQRGNTCVRLHCQ